MAFEPAFMRRFAEFDAERRRVRTPEDWRVFASKWFDASSWPMKTPEQRAAESAHKRGPLRVGGRLWSYTSWVYDLSPDARYVYFSTLRRVGDPIRFPGSRAGAGGTAAGSDAHSAQECPYCEISTAEIGDDLCPQCGRQLVYEHYA